MSPIGRGSTTRAVRQLAICVIPIAIAVAAMPAVASATTVYVSPNPVTAPFSSCAAPGYNSVQAAINMNAPKTTVNVCKGTYAEQLVIKKELTITGSLGAVVKLPASPAQSTTPCDKAGEEDVISICVAGTVKLSALTVEGRWPSGTCKQNLFGIFAGGKASVSISNSRIVHAGAAPLNNGCELGGVGIQIGRAATSQVATATLSNDVVMGYQTSGIGIAFTGSKGTITKTTVKGAGKEIAPSVPTKVVQHGIDVVLGALGTISESTISENECENHNVIEGVVVCGPESLTQAQATGVLFFEEATGSSVTKSTIKTSDIGVFHFAGVETSKPQATIVGNGFSEDRDEAVLLDQGFAAINENTIAGPGNVGIQLLQYTGQTFGPRGTGNKDTISGMSKWAIQGLSDLERGDKFGVFNVTNSKISGNPGSTPKTSVTTNNPSKLEISLGTGNN